MSPRSIYGLLACAALCSANGGYGYHAPGHSPPAWPSASAEESRCTTASFLAPTSTAAETCSATRTTTYHAFTYTVVTSTRYATSVPSPLQQTTTYAPPFDQASTLLPSNLTFTSYSLTRNASLTDDGVYGQSAYAALWSAISYNTTLPFTTTVSPTPVPSSELVFPPALYTACPQSSDECIDCYKLPKDFIWGVAGSAFQIEGGLDFDGRGPAYLDPTGSGPDPGSIANAEIADMNYFLYKQDIARLAAIGVPYYSFSISWTRIVPFGTAGSPINQPGLDHYDDLINTCLEYGITPIVTLSHDDQPINMTYAKDGFADAFFYYAQIVMTRFSDRVPYWVTLNEPNINFGIDATAPLRILMGHAKTYHWYKEVLNGTGQITIKFANNLAVPLNGSSPDDINAALRYQDFVLGVLGNPIFLGENYPSSVLNTAGLDIVPLTQDQLSFINGTADFYSIDPYTAGFAASPPQGIEACASNSTQPFWPFCARNTNTQQDGWINGESSDAYAYIAPQYVRQQLGYCWNVFKPKGILISEFGFNPFNENEKAPINQLYDLERTLYYQWFLRETLKSIYEDGVNVIGALGWSFVDNDEFGSFAQQYGMQYVNRSDPLLARSYKRSLFDYVDFFHTFTEQ